MPVVFFETQYAIQIHDQIIEKSGGIPGVLDLGRLDSVISHIQNDDYYPDFLDKITHLCYSINKNHAFNDGNKRTSIALSAFFLLLNGYGLCVSNFIKEMENVAVWVAENIVDKQLLGDLIFDILVGESREETQLRLIRRLELHGFSVEEIES